MKKIVLCIFILLVGVNVFARPVDIKQLTEAANQGNAHAQYQLGYCYFYGEGGVPQDYQQAVYWYQKAADQEFAPAQVKLGLCYYYGDGASLNPEQGVYWFLKAAEQGDTLGQALLGNDLTIGKGRPQNYQLAYMWYFIGLSQATKANVAKSFKKALKNIEFRLTAAEITEAKQMAAEWLENFEATKKEMNGDLM